MIISGRSNCAESDFERWFCTEKNVRIFFWTKQGSKSLKAPFPILISIERLFFSTNPIGRSCRKLISSDFFFSTARQQPAEKSHPVRTLKSQFQFQSFHWITYWWNFPVVTRSLVCDLVSRLTKRSDRSNHTLEIPLFAVVVSNPGLWSGFWPQLMPNYDGWVLVRIQWGWHISLVEFLLHRQPEWLEK